MTDVLPPLVDSNLRYGRFEFEPTTRFREELLGLRNIEYRQRGQRALFLYSARQPLPSGRDYGANELIGSSPADILESKLARRLQSIRQSRVYNVLPGSLAPSIDTHKQQLQLSVDIQLDANTHEQLLASIKDGLDSERFGRAILTLTHSVPFGEVVALEGRREASRQLGAFVDHGQAQVRHITWSTVHEAAPQADNREW